MQIDTTSPTTFLAIPMDIEVTVASASEVANAFDLYVGSRHGAVQTIESLPTDRIETHDLQDSGDNVEDSFIHGDCASAEPEEGIDLTSLTVPTDSAPTVRDVDLYNTIYANTEASSEETFRDSQTSIEREPISCKFVSGEDRVDNLHYSITPIPTEFYQPPAPNIPSGYGASMPLSKQDALILKEAGDTPESDRLINSPLAYSSLAPIEKPTRTAPRTFGEAENVPIDPQQPVDEVTLANDAPLAPKALQHPIMDTSQKHPAPKADKNTSREFPLPANSIASPNHIYSPVKSNSRDAREITPSDATKPLPVPLKRSKSLAEVVDAMPRASSHSQIATHPEPVLQPNPPVHVTKITNQIARYLRVSTPEKTTLELEPEELGTLRFNISHGERISIQVIVERADTLDLIRRHIDLFQKELRDMGFGNSDFVFTGGQEQSTQQAPSNSSPTLSDHEIASPQESTSLPISILKNGRINLKF